MLGTVKKVKKYQRILERLIAENKKKLGLKKVCSNYHLCGTIKNSNNTSEISKVQSKTGKKDGTGRRKVPLLTTENKL